MFTQLITSSCYNTTRVSMNERPEQQTTTRSEISSYLEARSGEKRGELRAYVDEKGREKERRKISVSIHFTYNSREMDRCVRTIRFYYFPQLIPLPCIFHSSSIPHLYTSFTLSFVKHSSLERLPRSINIMKLVCFPWAGGSSALYSSWLDHPGIASAFSSVICIDYPGRASRFDEEPIKHIGPLVDDILDHYTCFNDEDKEDIVLFGHSFGAIVAFEVALRFEKLDKHPKVKAVFVSASGEFSQFCTFVYGQEQEMMPSLRSLYQNAYTTSFFFFSILLILQFHLVNLHWYKLPSLH